MDDMELKRCRTARNQIQVCQCSAPFQQCITSGKGARAAVSVSLPEVIVQKPRAVTALNSRLTEEELG
ncbi:hypothetical protein FTE28_04310 [Bacillus licheniformis]|uniref:Uncharacterized protein n=2 Tax=Bacillus licheniformis TaxID=1402 RepID=A0AB37GHH1_BACLI|nr:hypothetical protein AB684_10200 [Bacillus licheniformis]APJ27205.1 hypothetical protein BSZ43_10575 [Bacillus sp. H15-1]ASV15601.1 hypothetical protein CJO35_10665 [Bacillus sp. 1s-1]EQM27923.1 hypothetical protein N399_11995 [Bacillus licheniformis CG-B52]KUL09031.1 hypothetical protein LI17339_15635 [Bacillus licheniformis LMG 17339]MBC9088749.1 hypothetical protein [Bacillus sp. Y1]MBJ7887225.1 hypothetical protein [Bacillaceae bacterium HSR45]MBY8346757.1 hypothetical protein [Bacill